MEAVSLICSHLRSNDNLKAPYEARVSNREHAPAHLFCFPSTVNSQTGREQSRSLSVERVVHHRSKVVIARGKFNRTARARAWRPPCEPAACGPNLRILLPATMARVQGSSACSTEYIIGYAGDGHCEPCPPFPQSTWHSRARTGRCRRLSRCPHPHRR